MSTLRALGDLSDDNVFIKKRLKMGTVSHSGTEVSGSDGGG